MLDPDPDEMNADPQPCLSASPVREAASTCCRISWDRCSVSKIAAKKEKENIKCICQNWRAPAAILPAEPANCMQSSAEVAIFLGELELE